jgi:uncharacterized repeat protein (TIGR03803 family)
MQGKQQSQNLIFHIASRTTTVGVVFAIVLALMLALSPAGQAQTFKVIYNFTGGSDGSIPEGLTMDGAGNLYGPTEAGALGSRGTVFKLQHSGRGWVLNTLYSFSGGNDGDNPFGGVAIAPDGTLYGTTLGGGASGFGTVFHLKPPPTAQAPWKETVLYSFTGGSDGAYPLGDLTVDQMGSIYGTAFYGGYNNDGVIYKLTPSGGGWNQTVLYAPTGGYPSGVAPEGGVIFDSSGNLYGGFLGGGPSNSGTVFQLSPSGSGWTMLTLHGFTGGSDGAGPLGGLIFDGSGDLYGTTYSGGSGLGHGGTIFKLTRSNGGWTFDTLYDLIGAEACGPTGKLVMDADGNLYGTTHCDAAYGYGYGSVFKLKPSNGGWTYTSLHDFTYGSDGGYPYRDIVFDANGNLFGTAGSNNGLGLVFEITP